MATDLEKLVVQLSADIKGYEREMRKAVGVTNSQARSIENRYRAMNKNLDSIGRSAARALVAPLAGIGAALTVREVLQYADAWTSAKNSLAVAGVVGDAQADVLDRLYKSAQANAAPVGALADLFGKAAQASDNLGASQEQLLKFADGVAVALRVAGTSAGQASGALTQLGQLLGQGRVQAEEFNSVNEGARPILIAVANGLDAAGGSVSKLKTLVTEGKVSGQEFFQAFLKGLPTIQSMAAHATQTIEQGMTKVTNAFTKYIGETDASLGASQRLVAGLNALADNFAETADAVLLVAGVIAGALVGRSIAGMIAKLGLGIVALGRFTAALRAAATMAELTTALGGLSAAAGPVGLVIGGAVVAALALFSSSSGEASEGARVYAAALEEVRKSAKEAGDQIEEASTKMGERAKNSLTLGLDAAQKEVESAKAAVDELLTALTDDFSMSFATPEQQDNLRKLKKGLDDGTISAEAASNSISGMANADYNFQVAADKLNPLIDALGEAIASADALSGQLARIGAGPSFRQTEIASTAKYDDLVKAGKAFTDEALRQNSLSKDQLALEKEIAQVKKDAAAAGAFLTDKQIKEIAAANVAADARRGAEGKKTPAVKKTAEDRLGEDIQSIRDRTAALIQEQALVGKSYYEQEKRTASLDLEQEALKELREEARKKGVVDLDSIQLSDKQIAAIDAASEAYARQADILRLVSERQQRMEQAASDAYDAFKQGAMDAILNAENLGEALKGILAKLAEIALSNALDGLFKPATGGGSGGLFGGIFSAIGGILGFDQGGFTGAGSRNQPAGVVHKGEVVFNQDDVRRHGGPAAVDAMRRGMPGYAGGGIVGMKMPTIPSLARVDPRRNDVHVTVGIAADQNGNLMPFVQSVAQSVSRRTMTSGLKAYDQGKTRQALQEGM